MLDGRTARIDRRHCQRMRRKKSCPRRLAARPYCSGECVACFTWRPCPRGPTGTCSPSETVAARRLHYLPGGREAIQVAQASSHDSLWHYARRVSSEVGSAPRLSNGRAELRRSAIGVDEEDGAWPKTKIEAAGQTRPPVTPLPCPNLISRDRPRCACWRKTFGRERGRCVRRRR